MRLYVFLVCLLFALHVSGQENIAPDKITLNTGEIYVGKIVLKTANMIMMTTKDGTRYQFQLTEVAKMESNASSEIIVAEKKKVDNLPIGKSNFGGLLELSVGVSNAKYSFGWSPNTQLSLLFGNKNSFGGNLFVGAGIGYNSTFVAEKSSTVAFLPLFFRLQSALSKNRTAPFVCMDGGYSFALNSDYKSGGVLMKISTGITHRISYKTSLIVGIYAGVQSFSATLTETNELGTYSFKGETTMKNAGVKVGLIF